MRYEDFLARKAPVTGSTGIEPVGPINPKLFPFQRDCVEWALRRGKAALFASTGLGKTAQQLEWAKHVNLATDGDILILAPLAVAHQTVREASKFDIEAHYAKTQDDVVPGITVTNYQRLDKFDCSKFVGVVLDESSILKSFMGAIKRQLMESFKDTQFKLACTATPAPNDHMELGNHSEFLDVLKSHEMLTRWFINDTSLFGTYRLKGHAVRPFWDWVTSWARMLGMPSDLGYPDDGFVLPALETHRHIIDSDITADRKDGMLFRVPELSATSVHQEKRLTAEDRAMCISGLVRAEPSEQWLIWADTDYEADALMSAIPEAVEVRGSHSPEKKEKDLIDFAEGRTRVMVTKPKIAGFGLNLQRCARVAFIGPSYSYESYFQAIRRCWRFGQTRPVHVHIAMASTEREVWNVLTRKAEDHETMKGNMFAAARRAQGVDSKRTEPYMPTCKAALPSWLVSSKENAA